MISIVSFLSIFLMLMFIAIMTALTYTINFLFILMPIILVGSLVGLWFFIKMRPIDKWMKISKIGVVIGLVGSLLSFSLGNGMFRSNKVRYMAPEDRYELQMDNNIVREVNGNYVYIS